MHTTYTWRTERRKRWQSIFLLSNVIQCYFLSYYYYFSYQTIAFEILLDFNFVVIETSCWFLSLGNCVYCCVWCSSFPFGTEYDRFIVSHLTHSDRARSRFAFLICILFKFLPTPILLIMCTQFMLGVTATDTIKIQNNNRSQSIYIY